MNFLADRQFWGDIANNTRQAAGGLLSATLGAPVDIATMVMRPFGYKVDDKKVVGSSEHIAGLLGLDSESIPYKVASLLPTDATDLMKYASVAPGLLGVVKPVTAKKTGIPVNLPSAPEFAAAVKNTPSASITDDGLLLRVMRGQMPQQAQMESVRGGVFYLPEGAAQMKHYSTGKAGYGGSEKIVGETLVRNPIFAKGGTGGKVPENAYDSLLGKGSYQNMRGDALAVVREQKPSSRAVLADEFLDKYAPELSGMGQYIVNNSGKSNQLPYALQEAAVSSAVRSAGHDAVLGYSKGKQGPFVSELFDVRESHYPDKFGWSRLFPQFEPK